MERRQQATQPDGGNQEAGRSVLEAAQREPSDGKGR